MNIQSLSTKIKLSHTGVKVFYNHYRLSLCDAIVKRSHRELKEPKNAFMYMSVHACCYFAKKETKLF